MPHVARLNATPDEIFMGIRLLPDWSSPEIFVHAVYPTRRFLPAKLQVFLEHLKAWKSPLWIPLR